METNKQAPPLDAGGTTTGKQSIMKYYLAAYALILATFILTIIAVS